MHSYQLVGVPKYTFLMSQHMNLATEFEMVLLMIILAVDMSVVGVLTSPA